MVKQEVISMDASEVTSIRGTKLAGMIKTKPVPNSIKKKRTNFRLRKVLAPKAPLVVLNEIVGLRHDPNGSVNYTFLETPVVSPSNMATNIPTTLGTLLGFNSTLDPDYIKMFSPHLNFFTAQCEVDGETFSGTGMSKQIAKNACAENAIAHVVAKRSEEARSKEQTDAEGNPLKPNQMEDDTPWAQLASLALFKLFSDWQCQGKTVPNVLCTGPQKPAKKLPENPTDRHPVQLLNELRGGVIFNPGEVGTSPNIKFTIGVEIDGKSYTGEGKTKKEAKKNCAIEVLKQVHNIAFNNTLN